MELLALLEAKLGRWLAYADFCVNADLELPRCQPFWTFVAAVLVVVCAAAVAGIAAKILLDRRKRATGLIARKYGKPS